MVTPSSRPSPGLYDRFGGLYTPRELTTLGRYLSEELSRSKELLSRPGHPKVCFLSYLLRNERRETVRARLGAIAEHRVDTRTHVFCDVRVGSYRYDQVAQGGLEDNATDDESMRYIEMPTEVSEDAYRVALWRLTEARYREAAVQYYARKSDEVHYVDEARKLPARRRMEGERYSRLERYPELDVERWRHVLKRASSLLRNSPDIQVSEIELSAWHRQQRFVSTEGADIAEQRVVYDLHATFWMLAPGGYRVEQEVSFVTGEADELPDEQGILALVRERIALLRKIAVAPHLPSYTGAGVAGARAGGALLPRGHRTPPRGLAPAVLG
ncbi:MAG: hypothetical protein IPN77_17135 [Sandaracinaceae bacterium]|nr:hypothetical protein [Sandaracinaceae bacterium]